MLKPQDIVVLMKILSKGVQPWAQGTLAVELGMSASEVNAGIKRLLQASLVRKQGKNIRPVKAAIEEFLVHGLRYIFPIERGEPTRGLLAAHAADAFKSELAVEEPPPVWPDAEGQAKGYTVKPLYKCVPFAVKQDQKLYDYLAIVDVLRSNSARDRRVAKNMLQQKLSAYE